MSFFTPDTPASPQSFAPPPAAKFNDFAVQSAGLASKAGAAFSFGQTNPTGGSGLETGALTAKKKLMGE